MKPTRIAMLTLVICLMSGPARCQPVAPQMATRMGTKTTEPELVVFVTGSNTLGELEKVIFEKLRVLYESASKAGAGPMPQFIVRIDLPTTDDEGTIVDWEAAIPVTKEVIRTETGKFAELNAKKVQPQTVAYTYHQGALDGVEFVVQTLLGWMTQNGHPPGQKLEFVSRSDPVRTPSDEMVLEVRIPLATPTPGVQ